MTINRSRIRSINPKDPNAIALIIEAIEVSEGIRGKEEDRKPTMAEVRKLLEGRGAFSPFKKPAKSNPASFVQPPSGLKLAPAEFSQNSSGTLQWLATTDSTITGYTIEVYPNNGDTLVFSTSVGVVNSFILPYFEPGHYDVRMRAIALGGRSEITQLDVAHEVPLTTEITGLQLVGGFTDASALFTWQPAADEATMDYMVQIYAVGGNTPVYTERVTAPYFEFSYAKNLESGLRREFTIQVLGINLEGATGASASITVKNPEPVTPVFSQVARTNSIRLSWAPDTATDYVGTKILWRKTGQGFSEIVVPAQGGYYEIPDLDNTTDYEIKMAGVDVFGEGVYSALSGISTLAPVNPGAFVIEEGVNQASAIITPVDGYVGVKLWLGTNTAPVGNSIFSGGDLSIITAKLTSGTQYHLWYRALDLKGEEGALVGPVSFSTVKLGTPDIDGLSPWATKIDKADATWIAGVLEDNAIESTKIKNLTAAKLTTGFLAATIGIQSGGSIESSNAGYKTGIGVYEDNGTVYTFMTANDTGDIKAGITADGVLIAKGAQIDGQVTITGGSGYANLTDKPTTLAGINSGEGSKLSGIAAGADVTDYELVAGLDLVASANMELVGLSAKKISNNGSWNGQVYSKQSYTGGAGVAVTYQSGPTSFMIGLNTDPTSNASYSSLDYALYATGSSYRVYESNADKGSILGVAPAAGDVLSVQYDGVSVKYLINGTVYRTVPAPANLKLSFDSSILYVNTQIGSIQFQPLTNLYQSTKNEIESSIELSSGGLIMDGDNVAVRAGKNSFSHTASGFWSGKEAGVGKFIAGSAASYIKFDGTTTSFKGAAEFITGSSGYANLSDKPTTLSGINSSEGTKLGGIATGADKTKTTIDGGLITTGSITLDGSTGCVKAGKTGFTTVGSGFWLGLSGSPSKAGLIVGNVNEYLSFREDQGIRLETPDLSIGAGGQAAFSGAISAAGNRFNVSRTAWSPTYMPNGTDSAVCAIKTLDVGVAGIASYSYEEYGGFFESDQGDGVRGISKVNDGGKFSSTSGAAGRFENNSGISGMPTVIINSKNKAAHLQLMTRLTQFPYAPNGSICFGGPSDATARFFMRVKGKWGAMPWAGHVTDGNTIPS